MKNKVLKNIIKANSSVYPLLMNRKTSQLILLDRFVKVQNLKIRLIENFAQSTNCIVNDIQLCEIIQYVV